MKIVTIFAEKLFAFHYSNEASDELSRLLNEWNDSLYLHTFVKQHKNDLPKNRSVIDFVTEIIENANYLDDILNELSENKNRKLDEFFKPLNNQEYRVFNLSKQKGRSNYLRIYALKIDANCYVITGGAIKFTHLMEDRLHTKRELIKIEKCKNYLKENNVLDFDSFYEFLNETE